jgi:hypothetical protein
VFLVEKVNPMKSIILLLVILPFVVHATPQISNVAGSIENNQSITINGLDFGEKIPASPIKWDQFEAGSNGANLSDVQPEWRPYSSSYGSAIYSNVSYSGDLSVSNNTNRHGFATNYLDIIHSDEVFVSYWWRIDGVTGDDGGVVKLTRINSSAAAGGGGRYNGIGETYLSNLNPGTSSPYFAYNNGDGNTGPIGYVRASTNAWSRVDMGKKLSTPGISDGSAFCQNLTEQRSAVHNNVITRAAGHTFQLDTVLLGLMMANDVGTFSLYLDDIYIDNTLARVEIGNNSDFDSCTHREMQLPTSWDGNNELVTINFNQGAFTAGETVWLFVINSLGEASDGYQLEISQNYSSPGIPGQPQR